MGREENYYQSRGCNCGYNKSSYIKTTYRESYAKPDDSFYEKEDVRWGKSSDDGNEECSHRGVPSIDRETRRALSSFRKKSARLVESETTSESDSNSTLAECCSHCECSGVMKKAQDLLNYSPESNFLKKLKRQSEMAYGEGRHKGQGSVNESGLDDNKCSGCSCRCWEDKKIERQRSEERRVDRSKLQNDMRMLDKISPIKEQECEEDNSQKSLRTHKVKSSEHGAKISEKVKKGNEENIRPKKKAGTKKKLETKKVKRPGETKVQHVSRPRKKSPSLKRKPRELQESRETESLTEFSASLKRPRPDSCERCWKYASPARSPVNKPDQRYDPNYRRAHGATGEVSFGSGDFPSEDIDHETKVMELMTPIGSMPRGQDKSPEGRNIGQRSKSQGAKKKKPHFKKGEKFQSHTSAIRPSVDQDKNWESVGSTQYLEPPEKITGKRRPSAPPKPKTAPAKTTQKKTTPIKKDDRPERKKSEKFSKAPSIPKEQPSSSSPVEDSPETQIKTIDMDIHPEKHSTYPYSQRTEPRVPLASENNSYQRQPFCPCRGTTARLSSQVPSTGVSFQRHESISKLPSHAPSTIPLLRQESNVCNCKINRHTHRSDEFLKPVPSKHSMEPSNRSYRSSAHQDKISHSSSRPRCYCNQVPKQEEELPKTKHVNIRGKSQKCCCKCHCGTKHCIKQKYVVNDRMFPEPINKRPTRVETDTSDDLPCSCPECRRRWLMTRRTRVRSEERGKPLNEERICSCRGRSSQNEGDSPRKYSVFYMTEDRSPKKNEIEVMAEGLRQKSGKNKRGKIASEELERKIKNITQYRPDSMALRFQKGVTEKQRTVTSPRILYF